MTEGGGFWVGLVWRSSVPQNPTDSGPSAASREGKLGGKPK